MTATHWSKWFWADWESDEALRQCSLAAQGLWMRMLCICAKDDHPGYLTIAGEPLGVGGVAKMAGVSTTEATTLVAELDRWGVFSRDRKGRIYSRRMVRDIKRSKKGQKNAKRRWSQPSDKKQEKSRPNGVPNRGPKTHKPEARSQKKERTAPSEPKERKRGARLPTDWAPSQEHIEFCLKEGLTANDAAHIGSRFRDYWIGKAGAGGVKLDWLATWRNWVREDINRGRVAGRRGTGPNVGSRSGQGAGGKVAAIRAVSARLRPGDSEPDPGGVRNSGAGGGSAPDPGSEPETCGPGDGGTRADRIGVADQGPRSGRSNGTDARGALHGPAERVPGGRGYPRVPGLGRP